MRWDGRKRPHYEVWYTMLNQLNTGAGFWIQYQLLSPENGAPSVGITFAASLPHLSGTEVAGFAQYSMEHFSSAAAPFSLQIGPCTLQEGRITGMIDSDGVPSAWDLVYSRVTEPLQYLPDLFHRAGFIRSKLVVPHPFMLLGGKIEVGDHRFILNGDPGHQGHLWGSRHPEEWIWFHCSAFLEDGGDPVPGYVTGVTARQRIAGGLVMPPLSFGHLVWHENHIAITPSHPWERRWNGAWAWRGVSGEDEVTVNVVFPWNDALLAEYEDPGGGTVFCHHTDRGECVVGFRAPRRPPRLYRAAGMAHAQIGSREPDPRVRRRVTIMSMVG